ncbi:MAG: TRAP transporter large permease [candidate division WOR-3 bacterium]
MSPIYTGVLGILILLFLFAIRVPVAFAMGIMGFLGFTYLGSVSSALEMVAVEFFDVFSSYTLTVLPMFVLMGAIAFRMGMSNRIFDSTYVILGNRKGGLAIASILGCAAFAGICGSTNATAAAMGSVALPHMRRYNYDLSLATGSVAAAGTLGILIPPSALLIIYGIISEQSIRKLFLGGVIPGIVLAISFSIVVSFLCSRNPKIGPPGPPTSMKEKLMALSPFIEVLVLFALVLGGLLTGWFSATQAGAAGALAVSIIGLIRRELTIRALIEAAKDTLLITCMVMFVLFGAILFSRFMAVTKIPFLLSSWIGSLKMPREVVIFLIILVHLIGGCFMDGLAMIMLTVPILLPAVISLGYDPIWFGIVVTLIVEMAAITPPVGINVYVIKSIAADVPNDLEVHRSS